MATEEYAKLLAADLGISGGLARSEGGVYRLQAQPELVVELFPQDRGWVFRTVVGEAPTGDRAEEGFLNLLLANLLGQGTGDGVLSLSEKGDEILLSREINEDLPYVEFKERLEEFLNYAEFWTVEIE